MKFSTTVICKRLYNSSVVRVHHWNFLCLCHIFTHEITSPLYLALSSPQNIISHIPFPALRMSTASVLCSEYAVFQIWSCQPWNWHSPSAVFCGQNKSQVQPHIWGGGCCVVNPTREEQTNKLAHLLWNFLWFCEGLPQHRGGALVRHWKTTPNPWTLLSLMDDCCWTQSTKIQSSC